MQVQDPSEDKNDEVLAISEEDKTKTIKERTIVYFELSATFFTKTLNVFFLIGNIVFSLGSTFYFFALLQDVISLITINNSSGTLNVFFLIGTVYLAFFALLAIPVLITLGLFSHDAVITILKNNRHQENNVSFYIYVNRITYLKNISNQIIQNRFSFRYLFANTYFF